MEDVQKQVQAVLEQPIELKKLLDEQEVDLNQPEEWHPLLTAAFKGLYESVGILLDHGAEIDRQNQAGLTALMAAADQGSKDRVNFTHTQTVELLLKRGAKTEIFCQEGFNALMLAAADGSLDMVKLLVEHGAKVNTHFKNESVYVSSGRLTTHRFSKWTPIMFASAEGHEEIVDYLRDRAEVNSNQLMDYVRSDYLEGVKLCWNIAEKKEYNDWDRPPCPVYCAQSALIAKSEQVFEYLFSKFSNDEEKVKTFTRNLLEYRFDDDLYPWLVKRGLYTPDSLLSRRDEQGRDQITQSEGLYRSALMKSYYELINSYPVVSPVVVLCESSEYEDRGVKLMKKSRYGCKEIGTTEESEESSQEDEDRNEDSDDKKGRWRYSGVLSETQVNFPTPNSFIDQEPHKSFLKEHERDLKEYYKQIKSWFKIGKITVSEIIRFLEEFKGSYFLDIYFEDLGASGLGGYRVVEHELFVKEGQLVYCNKYHVDRSYGVSHSFLHIVETKDKLIEELEEGHSFQKKEYGINDEIFYGQFLLQAKNICKEELENFFL